MVLEILLILLFLLTLGGFSYIVWFLTKQQKQNNPLEGQLREMRESLDTKLEKNTDRMFTSMREQMQDSKRLITDITRELTEVKETGKQVLSFTEQLQQLEQILKNPQGRGALGEHILEQVLANVLPPETYQTQYTFKNGSRADAVIFLQENKKVAVDAKFSLSAYSALLSGDVDDTDKVMRGLKENLKARVKETAKYILPEEDTLDFAFMFLPSEALYYDFLTNRIGDDQENLIEFAFRQHKVIIISPTTLVAYLQTVYMGLRSLKIEEQAQEILKRVQGLDKHLNRYEKYFTKVGKSIGTTVSHYNTAQQQYKMIDTDVLKISETTKTKRQGRKPAAFQVTGIDKPLDTQDDEKSQDAV